MENNRNSLPETLKTLGRGLSHTLLMALTTLLLVGIAGATAIYWLNKDNKVQLTTAKHIDITPTQIRSIERIGEWEFLAVSDEELVDTLRHGFFGDAQLARIYYGTLRIGVNLHEAKPGWIKANKDTVVATLPPLKLLDHDFIDEARTRAFHESGTWTEQDRKALYQKAYRLMKERCLNAQNMASAEQNAAAQFSSLLRSMGYEFVHVEFEKADKKK